MGILRAFGYFIAILILIGGIVLIPLGIPLIIGAIIMMYVLHKGGQVSAMKKDLKNIKQLQEDVHKAEIEKDRLNLQRKKQELESNWD